MNCYVKYGHRYWLENCRHVRIDYANGNYVRREYQSIETMSTSDKWYRQDGSQVIFHPDDIRIYDDNNLLQETRYVDGRIEHYY